MEMHHGALAGGGCLRSAVSQGEGGSSGNWHLLTRSVPALSKFIVTVVVVVGSAVGRGAPFSLSSTAENVSLRVSGRVAEEHGKTRIAVKRPGLRDGIV